MLNAAGAKFVTLSVLAIAGAEYLGNSAKALDLDQGRQIGGPLAPAHFSQKKIRGRDRIQKEVSHRDLL